MKFGVMLLPRSLDETREAARLAESVGFAWVSVADSPTVYEESYLHQLEVARAAETVSVGPMVTHVVVRHPLIVGNLLTTLNRMTGGRAIGTLGTGNSAARGLGLKPATLAQLEEAVTAIRSYWRGEGGTYGASRIPATGLKRDACPLFIAGDGPAAAALAGRAGDGLLYGGTMDSEVARRRLEAAAGKEAWIAPTVSLASDHDAVAEDLGAMVVAMANRAMRGDLTERGVPPAVQEDVLAMRRAYDYAFHADSSRPQNLAVMSPRLRAHLIDSLCLWGDEGRWRTSLDALANQGWAGVMLILGQAEQVSVVRGVGERLQKLGYLRPPVAS
jgi:alkanesulfonate monooxygenase SsuD/methylene tetrahydromethanopterin reductase-like flavin-dependent oxidoreductase (luciferase family)